MDVCRKSIKTDRIVNMQVLEGRCIVGIREFLCTLEMHVDSLSSASVNSRVDPAALP